MDAIVLGGGIAGLAAAHGLVTQGADVTVLEAEHRLGGLGGTFEHEGRRHERFYHSVTASDHALLALIEAAGLEDQCTWRKTTMGMVVAGEHFDFSTPLDLLRFRPLSLAQRLRLGLVGKSLRTIGRNQDLDVVSAEEWLRPLFGEAVWRQVIRPLFAMKFGDAPVPALYLYERLARESNVAFRAYPEIGYQGLADGIADAIRRHGGQVLTDTPVRSLEIHDGKVVVATPAGEFDARFAVSTLPLPLLRSVSVGQLPAELPLADLAYMGVVNMLFLTTRALDGHYWSAVIDSGTEFDGQIEMSALTGTERWGGLHATYVMAYTDRDSALYRDREVADRWRAQFLRLNDLRPAEIRHDLVFRAPFVEPVWPLGYRTAKPRPQVGDTPLFLATTAQAYPRVTSWNAAVETANETVAAMEVVA